MDQRRHSTPGDTYVPVPASEDCHPSLDPSVERELQTNLDESFGQTGLWTHLEENTMK